MGSHNNQRPFLDGTAASDNAGLLNNDDHISQYVQNPGNYDMSFAYDPSLNIESAYSGPAQDPSQSHSTVAVKQPSRPATPSQCFDDAYQPQVVPKSESADNAQAFYRVPEVSPEIAAAVNNAYPFLEEVFASANNPYPAASTAGNNGARVASATQGSGMDNMGQTQAFACNGLGGLGIPNPAGNWQQGQNANNGQPRQAQVQQGNHGPSILHNNVQSYQTQVLQGNSVPIDQCYLQAQMPQHVGHPSQQYFYQSQMAQVNGGPSMRLAHQSRNMPTTSVRAPIDELDYDTPVKVSHRRKDKRNERSNADRVYVDEVPVPPNWEAELPGGQTSLFAYSPEGQFKPNQLLTKEELRAYFDQCPRRLRLWVQQSPAQSNHRCRREDRQCRWADCPVSTRTINSGWLRVAFDEYYELTSACIKDPFHMAGSVHLWCFEQCFDPLEYFNRGQLRLDKRQFLKEEKNPMSVLRDTDTAIEKDWLAWRKEQEAQEAEHGPPTLPRLHSKSLSYCLVTHHLRNQPEARRQVREARNVKRNPAIRKTADVHLGDLQYFVDQTNEEKRRRRNGKAAAAGQNMAGVYADNSAIADVIVCAEQVPQDPDADPDDMLPLVQYMNNSADQGSAPARSGQKRPRNDVELEAPLWSDGDDDDDDDGSLFGFPRNPKRARIEKDEGGRRRFECTMARPRRHPRRRRSYCCGDEPSRFRRGSLRLES